MLKQIKNDFLIWKIQRKYRHDKSVKRVDIYTGGVDKIGCIFKTTGDMAIPYCLIFDGAIRKTYTDENSLYVEYGDIVTTNLHGYREKVGNIFKK